MCPFHPLFLAAALLAGCAAAPPGPEAAAPRAVRPAALPPAPAAAPPLASPPPAPAPKAADPEPPAPPDYDNNVYFDSGKAAIGTAGLATLARHAERLKADPEAVVTLVGHTDPLGSRAYNLAVCEARLDSVEDALRARGVARRQIRRIGLRIETREDEACRAEGCRQSLRRVELVYGAARR